MPLIKKLPNKINDFEILKDLGIKENKIRYALLICKACKKTFKTSVYHINKIKSCGCLPDKKMKPLALNINGFKIIKDIGFDIEKKRRSAIVECKVCNRHYEIDPYKLKYRKHCGCIKNGSKVCKYASKYPRLMQIYQHMIGRCYRKNNKDYYLYGERGIQVCNEWKGNPDAFCEWALNNGYKDNLLIDRINSNGNYEPANCRWTNATMQARNTSRNVLTMELAQKIRNDKSNLSTIELSLKYNVSLGTIRNVINNKSWT